MGHRYFPVTVMAGRLFPHGSPQPEEAVDGILERSPPSDRKINTQDELSAALKESAGRHWATTVRVAEGLEDDIRRM